MGRPCPPAELLGAVAVERRDPLGDEVDAVCMGHRSAELGHHRAGIGGLHAEHEDRILGRARVDPEAAIAGAGSGGDGWLADAQVRIDGIGRLEEQSRRVGGPASLWQCEQLMSR